jgi:hypothetical protein
MLGCRDPLNPPPIADIGSQGHFIVDIGGKLLVRHEYEVDLIVPFKIQRDVDFPAGVAGGDIHRRSITSGST